MHAKPLPSGETAVLLLAAGAAATRVESLLAAARLDELPAPRSLGEPDLLHAMPALRARLAQVDADLLANDKRRGDIAAQARAELEALQAQLHDLLLLAEAQAQVRSGELLFVIEGWLPEPALAPLRERVAHELGPEVVVDKVGTEPWTRADAPVALANPRLFQPFELITRAFPLPRYGSIDPTPFVAVSFPMFFGLMMGDVGYGLAARQPRCGHALALARGQQAARGGRDGPGLCVLRDRVRRALRRVLRLAGHDLGHAARGHRPREITGAVPELHDRARPRPHRAGPGASRSSVRGGKGSVVRPSGAV